MSRAGAWVDRPITVPCGQCTGCRLENSRQWAVRIMHEAAMHEKNCFLTLTLNDENIPEDNSLDITLFQKFVKRARKKLRFRYFHCGEYGDHNGRPHYHACIFGEDWSGDRKFHKTGKLGHPIYTSSNLDNELWKHGHCYIGSLTWESAAYVARYVLKKVTGSNAAFRYAGVDEMTGEELPDLKPEYCSMSRRPGLGAKWIERYMDETYHTDTILSRGQKSQPPKFYDRELEKLNPELLQQIKDRRASKALRRAADSTPDRLRVREQCVKNKIKRLTREL